MELDALSEYYYDKKLNGMDFSEIRRELKAQGLDDPDIKIVVNSIDTKLLNGIRQKDDKLNINTTRIIGIFLVVSGTVITIGTYAGWIRLGGYFIFAYGPILGGLAMVAASRGGRSTIFNRKQRLRR